jgi:16S rRNA (guanine966-N2)-methyltransferase
MRAQVRLALFNSLGDLVPEAAVLDLFCGSGCLGLEALSRGASRAVFVDKAKASLNVTRRNVRDLGVGDRAALVQHDLAQGVTSLVGRGPFDLVLVHPPFAILKRPPTPSEPDVAALLRQVAETEGLLAADAWIAFETPRACYENPEDLPGLTVERRKVYGSTALFLATPAEA